MWIICSEEVDRFSPVLPVAWVFLRKGSVWVLTIWPPWLTPPSRSTPDRPELGRTSHSGTQGSHDWRLKVTKYQQLSKVNHIKYMIFMQNCISPETIWGTDLGAALLSTTCKFIFIILVNTFRHFGTYTGTCMLYSITENARWIRSDKNLWKIGLCYYMYLSLCQLHQWKYFVAVT